MHRCDTRVFTPHVTAPQALGGAEAAAEEGEETLEGALARRIKFGGFQLDATGQAESAAVAACAPSAAPAASVAGAELSSQLEREEAKEAALLADKAAAKERCANVERRLRNVLGRKPTDRERNADHGFTAALCDYKLACRELQALVTARLLRDVTDPGRSRDSAPPSLLDPLIAPRASALHSRSPAPADAPRA